MIFNGSRQNMPRIRILTVLLFLVSINCARSTVYTTNSTQILRQVQTVFIIAMENHNFTQPSPGSSPQQISNNVAAPYITSLITPGNTNATQVSFATHYYNAGSGVHPSEPSYIWAEGGTDFGYHTDNDPSAGSGNIFTAPHLSAQLSTAGVAWKNYQEDVQYSSSPTVSASGSTGAVNAYNGRTQRDYAAKHNPMVFYSDTQTKNYFSLTNLQKDLTNNTVGRYNWITPNQFNDMHSALTGGFTYHGTTYTGDQAAIAQGDNFLSIIVPQITASTAYKSNGILILWWDEAEGGDSTSYAIPELLLSPLAKGNAYKSTVEYCHSSDIKTVEEIFGLSFLSNNIPASETKATGSGYNNVATVNDLSDMFAPVALVTPYNLAISNLSGGNFNISFRVGNYQSYKILATTNVETALAGWTPISIGTATTNMVTYQDTNVFTKRFYCVVSP